MSSMVHCLTNALAAFVLALAPPIAASLTAAPAHAAEIHVPADAPTIQAAIDASANGDVIVIAAGTYAEHVHCGDRTLTLRGAGADATILDGSGAFTPSVACGPGAWITIESLAIHDSAAYEGAVSGEEATVVARDCRFVSNETSIRSQGGVLSVDGCVFTDAGHDDSSYISTTSTNVALRASEFRDGAAINGAVLLGGGDILVQSCTFRNLAALEGNPGLVVAGDGDILVEDCVIEECGGDGSILRIVGGASRTALVRRCRITDVSSNDWSPVSCESSIRFEDCTFEQLVETESGVSITTLGEDVEVTFERCTFDASPADGVLICACWGGDVHCLNCVFTENGRILFVGPDSFGLLTNCVMYGNTSVVQGVIVSTAVDATARVDNCIIHGNTGQHFLPAVNGSITVRYCLVEGGLSGQGNIGGNPMFVDAPNDLRLLPGSPCIDAGSSLVSGLNGVVSDLDGNARLHDHPGTPNTGLPNGDGVVADMGAYEFGSPALPCTGDVDASGAVDFLDLLTVMGSWGESGPLPADANGDGVVDFGDLTLVLASWGPCS